MWGRGIGAGGGTSKMERACGGMGFGGDPLTWARSGGRGLAVGGALVLGRSSWAVGAGAGANFLGCSGLALG